MGETRRFTARGRRFRAAATAAMLLATTGVLAGPGVRVEATTAGVEHFPDLQTMPMTDFRIDTSSGRKLVRFSNIVANLGQARLELRPVNPTSSFLGGLFGGSTGTTRVYQGIFTHDANNVWRKVREVQAGTMTYHSSHGHWHFNQFALYELHSAAPDGSLGASLNRRSEKTTFCIIDTTRVSTTIEHAEAQRYRFCGRNDTTGISIGWADKYSYSLDGQALDVTGLADGTYWVVSTADYAGRILESNENNNQAAVKIQITGNTVSVVG